MKFTKFAWSAGLTTALIVSTALAAQDAQSFDTFD